MDTTAQGPRAGDDASQQLTEQKPRRSRQVRARRPIGTRAGLAPASDALLAPGVYVAPFRRRAGYGLLVAVDADGVWRADAEYAHGDELERERAHLCLERLLELYLPPSPVPGRGAKVMRLRA